MSATKIAANFRVSLTALFPKQPEPPIAVACAWLHTMLHTDGRAAAGSAEPGGSGATLAALSQA
jgi:hypothetical protein